MAANRIKGITIEIDGNTTKLQDSLKDVDKQLKTTQTNLRDINKLLKLDPKNTELVAQKQKNLKEAIDLTKKRLDALKNAQTEALSPEQYDALQREIIETETNLKSLETEYDNLNTASDNALNKAGTAIQNAGTKVTEAGQKITKVGDSIGSAGKTIAPVSAAVAGIGVAAVNSAKELDEGYDTIITKTGATGKAAEALQDQMDSVFTSIPTTAAEAGTAIGDVTTRFGLSGDKLAETSKTFIKFADINNTDLSSAINNTDSIMEKFGIDASEVDSVLGVMTKTGQDTGVSMDTLYGSLSKNGGTLKEMGLSLGQSVTLLGNMEANGVDTSTAMTALSKANQAAVKQGKSLDSVLKDGIKSIKGAKTQTDALQIATDLFGKKGATEMTQAIREGRFSIDDLNTSMDTYATTVQDTYEETLDPWDKMTVSMNSLKQAGAELASTLFDTLKPVIDQVVEAVKGFTTWFNSLSDGQKQLIIKIGLIVAAAAPLLIMLGSVISSIGSIISVGGKLITGFGKVTSAISAAGGLIPAITSLGTAIAPFLIGGAIIAGVIAAIVLIVKNWDTIKKGLANLWKGIQTFAGNVVKGVKDLGGKIATGIGDIKTAIGNKMTEIKTVFGNIWGNIKTTFSQTWQSIKTNVQTNIQNLVTSFSNLKTKVANIFGNILSAITSPFRKAWSAITEFVSKIKNAFKFKIELPKIKLPHINVKWRKVGDFLKIPTLSVQWYKKAYDNPMIFNRPTVLQTPYGAKGFGDGTGGEIVYGRNNLIRDIRAAVSDTGDITINVYGAEGQPIDQLANEISNRLAALQKQRIASYA